MARILIVDDNIEWLSSLRDVFLCEGFEVDAVNNGLEALTAAEKYKPDIIFTDLLMPDMDGFTLCQKLKSKPDFQQVPVIFCSGYFDEKDQKKLEDALGVSHFLHKPAEINEVLSLVGSILGTDPSLKTTPAHTGEEPHPALQEIYNTTMLEKLTDMVDMLHDERRTYKSLLLRFNSLTDSASDAIIIANAKGEICYWNQAADSLFQYNQDEVLHKSVCIIVPESMPSHANKILQNLFSPDEDKATGGIVELVAKRKDGSLFPAELSHSSWQEKDATFHSIILRDVSKRKGLEDQLHKNLESFIGAVAKFVEARDPYTAGHQRRVAMLAVAVATRLGLDEKTIQGVYFGAMIHDIGKISVPAEILSKPSRLSAAEFELIKSHTSIGFDIMADIDFPWPLAGIVHQHHERIDGSGYPQGLKGDEMLLEAKIIAVADVVEAITSHRPYRPAMGTDVALDEIKKNKGTLYDPLVADACLELFPNFSFE